MLFENGAYFSELLECLRELLLHLGDLHRSTNACNNVLALSVCQELTEEALVTSCRVTCESNTGTAVITHVTESHGLYVNGCTPGIRDIVVTTVDVSTRVVPGTEYSFDRAHELLLRICREIRTDLSLVLSLELVSELLEVVSVQLYVLFNALLSLHLVDELFEVLLTNFHNDVGVHLDESSVAVPSPARVIGLLCDNINNFFVETEVEDGIHHTRHGSSRTGTDGNEKRVLEVTEFLTGDLLHLADVLKDLCEDLVIDLTTVFIILCTSLCGDRKTLRNRKSEVGHLSKVCTLTAEELTHAAVALRKQVNIFSHCLARLSKY